MNKVLKSALEARFKPLGLIAYSGCCRLGCTGSYDEYDSTFELRPQGLLYFKLYLSGMNYDREPTKCYVQYRDFDFLTDSWGAEVALITDWCRIVGLGDDEYTIVKPENEDACVEINFKRALALDEEKDDDN